MTAISSEKITSFLQDEYKSLAITAYDVVPSTNTLAKNLAKEGKKLPFLIVSDSQTGGRGRLGRSFFSPAGTGIYMTLALPEVSSPAEALSITPAAAVAVTDAIVSLTGKDPLIKWVNDIFLGGRKICGILAESVPLSNGKYALVIGIGLNMTTCIFPDELAEVAASLDSSVPREQMIAQITNNLLEYSLCDEENIIARYKKRCFVLGKEIFFTIDGTTFSALAEDVDSRGGLLVRKPDGNLITLMAGEISIRLR